MAVQTAFAEEMSRLKDRDDGLLALLGQDSEFDLAFLNVKHRFRDVALFKNFLVFAKFENRFPVTDLGEKDFRVKHVLRRLAHNRPPLAQTTVVKSRAA